jgi:MerR family transcriptional regulator, mercuric resistance operon regulatory protein
MRISEVSAATGCNLETIRYYERIALVPRPKRTGNGYRAYGRPDIERIRFIARGRALGFSLEEVRSLLCLAEDKALSCREVDTLARAHLDDIRTRVRALSAMACELEQTISSCAGGQRGSCAILGVLSEPPGKNPRHRMPRHGSDVP